MASETAFFSFFSALVTMHLAELGSREVLVDVDADGRRSSASHAACEHAVASLAGDLEHDVDVLVLAEQLLRRTPCRRPGR